MRFLSVSAFARPVCTFPNLARLPRREVFSVDNHVSRRTLPMIPQLSQLSRLLQWEDRAPEDDPSLVNAVTEVCAKLNKMSSYLDKLHALVIYGKRGLLARTTLNVAGASLR